MKRFTRSTYVAFGTLGTLLLCVATGCSGQSSQHVKSSTNAMKQEAAPSSGQGGAVAAPDQAASGGETEGAAEAPQGSNAGVEAPPPVDIVKKAREYLTQGQYERAIGEAKEALSRSEKYVPAMIVMARAYYQLGKLEFAESICDIALSINANNGECFNIKGFVALKQDDAPLALTHFKKATEVDSEYGPAWVNLGAQLLKAKSFDDAVVALEKATQLLPNRAEAFFNLGSAYRGSGQLAKAQQAYLRALNLRNDNYPDVYFNLGILFLDAQEFPGMSRVQALNTSIGHFNQYKQLVAFKSTSTDEIDELVKEAEKAIDREQKRIERDARRIEREKAKKELEGKMAAEKAAKEKEDAEKRAKEEADKKAQEEKKAAEQAPPASAPAPKEEPAPPSSDSAQPESKSDTEVGR